MHRMYLPLLALLVVGCAKDAPPAMPTPTSLSPDGANHMGPTYSPDGSRLAGWQQVGNGFQLWLADSDLSNFSPQTMQAPGSFPLVWAPDGSKLALSQPGGPGWTIVTIPAAGGDATPIHTTTGFVQPLGWSSDGAKLLTLATESGGSYVTHVVDVASGTAQRLLPMETRAHTATFAPVGRHAVVMIYDSARATLWGLDSLEATPRQLTTEGYEFLPFGVALWSPDGSELVFESTRTGAPDLWVLEFATGTTRQLTNDLRADRRPHWSHDGEWILFESERGRQTDVWVVPAKGGEAIRLTDDPAVEVAQGWRGGSRQVAYTVAGGTGSIHAVPVNGREERQLSPDSVKVDYFEVSPDGSQIAFTSRRTGSALDIWVMPSGGGEARLVASPQTAEARVFWSPDGVKLAFVGLGGGTPDPWVLDVATGTLQQVLNWPSLEFSLRWGRDASELFVTSDLDSRFADVWRVPLSGDAPVRLTTEGRVDFLAVTLDGGTRLLISTLGGEGGNFGLGEVMPDGSVRTIYDARSLWSVAWNTPMGSDSVAVQLVGDDGENISVMMSLADGGMRQIGPSGTRVSYWSRNGTALVYSTATEQGSAIGVVDLASGAMRIITPSMGLEMGAEFLPGDSVVVFRRNRPENRIAVLDLADLLSRAR